MSELPTMPLIQSVALDTVRGLQDLPEEAQLALAKSARIESLNTEEELNGFAVALVLSGRVAIMPAIADVACAEAQRADGGRQGRLFVGDALDREPEQLTVLGEGSLQVASLLFAHGSSVRKPP